MIIRRSLLFTVLVAIAPTPVSAAVMEGLPQDSELRSSTTEGANPQFSPLQETALRVGGLEQEICAAIFVFDLPEAPAGQQFSRATLKLNLLSAAGATGFKVDLYALGVRELPNVNRFDFYAGPFGGDTTDAFPLHDDFAMPGMAAGMLSTDGGVGADAIPLVDLLNAYYTEARRRNEDPAAGYLFIRANPDQDPRLPDSSPNRIFFHSREDNVNIPSIDYDLEAMPEPASGAIFAAIAVLAARRRRGAGSRVG